MTGTEKKIVYMDHAATTYAAPEVVEAMLPYFSEKFGNPSSVYGIGQENKAAVEEARAKVAAAINAEPNEIYFTAGGTESDNWVLKGVAFANIRKGKHIITTAVEHHAILHAAEWLQSQGFEVTYLPVDQYGMVSPADVEKAIRPDTILISVMYANNEVGTIQPIAEIGAIARAHGIYFHTDAVQATSTCSRCPVTSSTARKASAFSTSAAGYGFRICCTAVRRRADTGPEPRMLRGSSASVLQSNDPLRQCLRSQHVLPQCGIT